MGLPRKESAVILVIDTPITSCDVPALCERMGSSLAHGDSIVCDVHRLPGADLVTVDALARLQLAVKARGGSIRLRGPSEDLVALLELTGLREVLRVEPVRQAEQREEPFGVEEEANPRDLSAGHRQDL